MKRKLTLAALRIRLAFVDGLIAEGETSRQCARPRFARDYDAHHEALRRHGELREERFAIQRRMRTLASGAELRLRVARERLRNGRDRDGTCWGASSIVWRYQSADGSTTGLVSAASRAAALNEIATLHPDYSFYQGAPSRNSRPPRNP